MEPNFKLLTDKSTQHVQIKLSKNKLLQMQQSDQPFLISPVNKLLKTGIDKSRSFYGMFHF